MDSTGSEPKVRYSYPLHAILLVAGMWIFWMVLIACYATLAIALFPMSPFVAIGGACLLGMAHEYAVSVRKPVRT
jgi:hypothetical protein